MIRNFFIPYHAVTELIEIGNTHRVILAILARDRIRLGFLLYYGLGLFLHYGLGHDFILRGHALSRQLYSFRIFQYEFLSFSRESYRRETLLVCFSSAITRKLFSRLLGHFVIQLTYAIVGLLVIISWHNSLLLF